MKNTKIAIKLRPVIKSDCDFLFNLLKERDPRVNISHKKMPTYNQHVRFVMSKPYSKWYIIENECRKVGSIYLTKQNEIGIFIQKKSQGKNIATIALNQLIKKNPRNRYLANVSPKNKKSARFFKKSGFRLIQHTYELEFDDA